MFKVLMRQTAHDSLQEITTGSKKKKRSLKAVSNVSIFDIPVILNYQ